MSALWCIPAGCDDTNVLLFDRAGGSVVFSMRSDRKTAAHLASAAGIRALVVDFRRSPEFKFPAQIDDVETVYRWLLSQGYAPEHIVSGGHSIGGNLAVGLAIRLRETRDADARRHPRRVSLVRHRTQERDVEYQR